MKFGSMRLSNITCRTIYLLCVIHISTIVASKIQNTDEHRNEVVDNDVDAVKNVLPKEPKFFDEFDCKYTRVSRSLTLSPASVSISIRCNVFSSLKSKNSIRRYVKVLNRK